MTAPASFDLAGRVALVTGGNGGIGRGIALGFAQAGAAVAIFGRNTAKNAEVLAALQGAGARAMALAVDVTDRAALERLLAEMSAQSSVGSRFTVDTILLGRHPQMVRKIETMMAVMPPRFLGEPSIYFIVIIILIFIIVVFV